MARDARKPMGTPICRRARTICGRHSRESQVWASCHQDPLGSPSRRFDLYHMATVNDRTRSTYLFQELVQTPWRAGCRRAGSSRSGAPPFPRTPRSRLRCSVLLSSRSAGWGLQGHRLWLGSSSLKLAPVDQEDAVTCTQLSPRPRLSGPMAVPGTWSTAPRRRSNRPRTSPMLGARGCLLVAEMRQLAGGADVAVCG